TVSVPHCPFATVMVSLWTKGFVSQRVAPVPAVWPDTNRFARLTELGVVFACSPKRTSFVSTVLTTALPRFPVAVVLLPVAVLDACASGADVFAPRIWVTSITVTWPAPRPLMKLTVTVPLPLGLAPVVKYHAYW